MSISDKIRAGDYKNIIVVSGAGVSTNSGIPDYRSSDGIFKKFMNEFPSATSPEMLFSRSFIEENKVNNSEVYKDLMNKIKDANPTSSHNLCKWLYDKGWLKRIYTQNIDGLYHKTGLPDEMIVEFHGSLSKNNVVLYGDKIPEHILDKVINDITDDVDLMLVMGTSLQVSPFCAIPNLVDKNCTRVLVDLYPHNAFTNNWSKVVLHPDGIYDNYVGIMSSIKIGKRLVSLRPAWNVRDSKWKNQHIISSDTDEWSLTIIN